MRASQGINGVQSGSEAGLQIGTMETVTQAMTQTGVGGGDLSGAVDDSRE